jgi:diguanylate cyclase (GGDEF)-like protein
VLPNTDEAGAEVAAARLLESVRRLQIPHENNGAVGNVTISIGATTVKVAYGHQYIDYIKRADEALYMSKRTGRNKYTHIKYIGEGDCRNEV